MTFEVLCFCRGMSGKYPIDRPYVVEPRVDRRPRDSGPKFHEIADHWFLERFGIRYRSQGVFVTPNQLTATAYAASPRHVARVVPLTEYRYCWSPRVSDLLFKAKELADADPAAIRQFLESAEYQESELGAAHEAGHEVMLHCSRYVAIPIDLLSGQSSTPALPVSGIVLP